jgi:hypothetical protein
MAVNAPAALQSPFELGGVNPEITLLEGAAIAKKGRGALPLARARVFISPFPKWGLRFEGEGESNDSVWLQRTFDEWSATRVEFPERRALGRFYRDNFQVGGDLRSSPFRLNAGAAVREVVIGSAKRLRSVIFHLPNFVEYIGDSITNGKGFWKGRLEMDDGEWHLTIDQRRDLSALKDSLREQGGYAVTHICKLDKNGTRFLAEDAKEVIQSLHWFFSFVRGAWTSPTLLVGEPARSGSEWQRMTDVRLDRWTGAFMWSDPFTPQAMKEAFSGYRNLWGQAHWQQGLRTAVGLYVTANRPDPMEVAIIAAQSGLELLGWLTFVETNRVAPNVWRDSTKYPAHKKIRDLLMEGAMDPKLPRRLKSLSRLDPSWTDGPQVIAGVRNRLVHPRRAAGSVAWPTEVLTDAWRLSSRYLELVLLHSLGVTSNIRDRLGSPWIGATVKPPWV